jgi:CheY-like chemotaxis protein
MNPIAEVSRGPLTSTTSIPPPSSPALQAETSKTNNRTGRERFTRGRLGTGSHLLHSGLPPYHRPPMPSLLLVTDSDWVVRDVDTALAIGGWDMSVVSDPRTVVDAVEETRYDAVIVDLQVGSMGGMAIIRAIRASAASSKQPAPRTVLLLDRSADRFLAARALADASVLKPIAASDLRIALATTQPVVLAGSEEE